MFEKDRQRMVSFKDIPDEALQTIKTPALIMAGDHDVEVPEHVVAMSRLIRMHG